MKDQLKESELRWALSHITVTMPNAHVEYHPDKIIIEDMKWKKKYVIVVKSL